MKPATITAIMLSATLLSLGPMRCTTASAESWIFARSYYSHNPVQRVEVGRRPPRPPYFSGPQGEYYRSGLRYVNSRIVIRGQTYDNLRLYEGWVQVGGQHF
jgi:hypothetical protein